MFEIVKTKFGGEEEQAVNARELWEKLEVGTKFAMWIERRISEAQLVEGQDFIRFPNLGSEHRVDYRLTLDAAKHVAMLERNEIGKKVRQYFIDFEKKARQSLLPVYQSDHPLMVSMRHVIEVTTKYVAIEEEQKRMAEVQRRLADEQKQLAEDQAKQEKEIRDLEIKASAMIERTGYYTITAFCRLVGGRLNTEQAASMGREASKKSKTLGYPVYQIRDERYGFVNSYHEDVLRSLGFRFGMLA